MRLNTFVGHPTNLPKLGTQHMLPISAVEDRKPPTLELQGLVPPRQPQHPCRGRLVQRCLVHGCTVAPPMEGCPAHVAVDGNLVLVQRHKQRDICN